MYKKKILGNLGEDIACKFILNKGYEIVERNFYCRQGEIDIIAKDNEFLVFIEVIFFIFNLPLSHILHSLWCEEVFYRNFRQSFS